MYVCTRHAYQLWIQSGDGIGGLENSSGMKFEAHPTPLTPLSVAHEFNGFILEKKFDHRSNALVHSDGCQTPGINDYRGSLFGDRFGETTIGSTYAPHIIVKVGIKQFSGTIPDLEFQVNPMTQTP